jgi:hypothetical protein
MSECEEAHFCSFYRRRKEKHCASDIKFVNFEHFRLNFEHNASTAEAHTSSVSTPSAEIFRTELDFKRFSSSPKHKQSAGIEPQA